LVTGSFQVNQALLLQQDMVVLKYALIVFIFVSAVCANVYSASVGWELVAPKSLVGRQEYLILGLSLTMFYIHGVLAIADSALVNFALVLLVAYVLNKSFTHTQKMICFSAWVVATVVNAIQLGFAMVGTVSPIFASFMAISLILGSVRILKRPI
jgi:hypothetical protein